MLSVVIGALWLKEASDTYCPNNTSNNKNYDQLACQKSCEANTRCVGIALTHKAGSACFLCLDDVLSSYGVFPNLNYGFYRRPLGNN